MGAGAVQDPPLLSPGKCERSAAGEYLFLAVWVADDDGCALDCSEAAAVHAAKQQISRDGKGTVECYFGRIDDPAIETVAVSIQEVTYDQGQETRRELRRLTAERSEFLTRDGRTFFWLMEVQDGEIDPEQIIQPVLTAWGEDGTVVAEFTIRQESFASYG